MTAKKRASRRSLDSDLKRVDAHVIQRHEYDELPELTGDMLARGKVNKGGRPRSPRRHQPADSTNTARIKVPT